MESRFQSGDCADALEDNLERAILWMKLKIDAIIDPNQVLL